MFRIRQIQDHPNYAVTDNGKVFNIISGNELRQHKNHKGYYMVKLDGEKGMAVHRLVAFAFVLNEHPEKFDQVNHKKGNKWDNRANMLEWIDNQGNQLHAYRTGLQPKIVGAAKHNAKLTEEQVHDICKILQANPSFGGRRIQRMLGLGRVDGIITRIKNRSNWKHISEGYSW